MSPARFDPHRLVSAALVLLALGAAGWWAWARWTLVGLQPLLRTGQPGVRLTPEPRVTAEVRARDLAIRDEWRAHFAGLARAPAASAVPPDRPAAFLDLLRFRERMSARARSAGIGLADDGAFGFAAYAQAGPDDTVRAGVHQQRILAESLIHDLFAARPTRWIRLRRSRPPGEPVPEQAAPAETFLAPNPAVTAAVGLPGGDWHSFELTFVGSTETLRRWLHALADDPRCLVVRQVRVAPEPAEAAGDGSSRVSGQSRFAVTVDFHVLPR